MVSYPIPNNEILRLEALKKYNILDTIPESAFDDVVELAAQICDVPISLISLVDKDRQWFKAKLGLDAEETPRELAFCAHSIMQNGIFVVQDALLDSRFGTNPLVVSDPFIRFYAGSVLTTPTGQNIGTLCVIDRIPREITPSQHKALEALSRQVMAQLELRIHSKVLEATLDDLKKAESRNQAFLSAIPDSMYVISSKGYVLDLKKRREDELAVFGSEIISKTVDEILPSDLARATKQLVNEAIESQQVKIYEYEFKVFETVRNFESRIVKSGEGEAVAIVRDITERKESEKARNALMDEIHHKNTELSKKNEELSKSYKEISLIFSAFSELLPGTVLNGKYLLENKIGKGGYGVVYRGKHLGLNRPVAVKLFRPISGNDSVESLERFKLEGVVACQIDHPNAVSILDSGVSEEKIAYLVMELLEGYTLSQLLNQEKVLPLKHCIEIIMPICDVLAQAHQKGIIHRDIKPDNIFLHQTPKGELVKLLDFGIAKLIEEDPSNLQKMSATQGVIGTPRYLSPERLTNLPYDGKSDVYSLGILIYEALSGCMPFEVINEADFMQLAMAHLKSKPIPIREIAPNITSKMETLLNQMLAKSLSKRPTAREVFEELALINNTLGENSDAPLFVEVSNNYPLPTQSANDYPLVDNRITSINRNTEENSTKGQVSESFFEDN